MNTGSAAPAVTQTLLLVEDEPSVRRLIITILESAGFRVLAAPEAGDALRIAASHDGPIDLLVTDVTLPDMDGRDVAHAIRAGRPECRVLFISGYPTQADVPNGGIDVSEAFLQKPFVPRVLVQRVRELLSA